MLRLAGWTRAIALAALISACAALAAPQAARGATVYEESFEGGTSGWTVRSGKSMPSIDLQEARTGRISVKVGRDQVMERRFSEPQVGTIEAWLYDPGTYTPYEHTRQVLAGEMGGNFFMVGISTNVSPTHYIYRAGGAGSEEVSAVPRTRGWRHLKIEFTGTMAVFYIDGHEVAASTLDGRFQAVGIGNYWGDAGGVAWWDDVRIVSRPAPAEAITAKGTFSINMAVEDGQFLPNRGWDLRQGAETELDITYKTENLEVFMPLRSTSLGERVNLGLNRRDVWHMSGSINGWTVNAAGARVDNRWGYTGGNDPLGLTRVDGINRTNATTLNLRGNTGKVSHIFYLGDRHDSFRFMWWRPTYRTQGGWIWNALALRRWDHDDFEDGVVTNLGIDFTGARVGDIELAGAVAKSSSDNGDGNAYRLALASNHLGWRWHVAYLKADPTFEAPISNADNSPVREVIGKGNLVLTLTRPVKLGNQPLNLKVVESYWTDADGYGIESVLTTEVKTTLPRGVELTLGTEFQELPRERNFTTKAGYTLPLFAGLQNKGELAWTRQTETFLIEDTFNRGEVTQGVIWSPGGGFSLDIDYTWNLGHQVKENVVEDITGSEGTIYGRWEGTAAPGRFPFIDALGGMVAVWTKLDFEGASAKRTGLIYGDVQVAKGVVSVRVSGVTSDFNQPGLWQEHENIRPTLAVTATVLTGPLGLFELEAKRRYDLDQTNVMASLTKSIGSGRLTLGFGETGFQDPKLPDDHEFKGMPWERLVTQGQSRHETRDRYYTLKYTIPF